MLLPELKKVAAGLGIKGASTMRKADLIAACLQPGASIAATAREHGMNANVLHRWLREHRLGLHQTNCYAAHAAACDTAVHSDDSGDQQVVNPQPVRAPAQQPAVPAFIAMALAQEAGVLLLDEPTSSLDVAAAAGIEELIAELGKSYPVIAVSHNPEQAVRLADRIFMVKDGRTERSFARGEAAPEDLAALLEGKAPENR